MTSITEEGFEELLRSFEHDAIHSEHDEPGCLRFNVLQDSRDEDPWGKWKRAKVATFHRRRPLYALFCLGFAAMLFAALRTNSEPWFACAMVRSDRSTWVTCSLARSGRNPDR